MFENGTSTANVYNNTIYGNTEYGILFNQSTGSATYNSIYSNPVSNIKLMNSNNLLVCSNTLSNPGGITVDNCPGCVGNNIVGGGTGICPTP